MRRLRPNKGGDGGACRIGAKGAVCFRGLRAMRERLSRRGSRHIGHSKFPSAPTSSLCGEVIPRCGEAIRCCQLRLILRVIPNGGGVSSLLKLARVLSNSIFSKANGIKGSPSWCWDLQHPHVVEGGLLRIKIWVPP